MNLLSIPPDLDLIRHKCELTHVSLRNQSAPFLRRPSLARCAMIGARTSDRKRTALLSTGGRRRAIPGWEHSEFGSAGYSQVLAGARSVGVHATLPKKQALK